MTDKTVTIVMSGGTLAFSQISPDEGKEMMKALREAIASGVPSVTVELSGGRETNIVVKNVVAFLIEDSTNTQRQSDD